MSTRLDQQRKQVRDTDINQLVKEYARRLNPPTEPLSTNSFKIGGISEKRRELEKAKGLDAQQVQEAIKINYKHKSQKNSVIYQRVQTDTKGALSSIRTNETRDQHDHQSMIDTITRNATMTQSTIPQIRKTGDNKSTQPHKKTNTHTNSNSVGEEYDLAH